jgi:pyruvate formate lyase activating enzyme
VSGGEPLMQPEFVAELFELCKRAGINCALDTSGCLYNEKIERLIGLCDLIILDYKYTNDVDYEKYVGMKRERVDIFLDRLQALGKRVWIRQVIIPGINNSESSVEKLYALKDRDSCIEKIELLPFRKLCIEKYRSMEIEFPLENTPEATAELIEKLSK